MRTQRVEALSDGVFAIAMTLLVLEIHVPRLAAPSAAALAGGLADLAPHVAAYVVGFLLLGTLWIGHHNHFVHIRRADRTLLWINVGFLCCVSFLPFSTGLLGAYWDRPLAAAVYGGNLLAAGVFLWLHWFYATRGRRLVAPDLPEEVVRMARRRMETGFAVYAAATLLAFAWLPLSLALFAGMPLVYMLPGRVDRHLSEP